eukprot:gene8903-12034_t
MLAGELYRPGSPELNADEKANKAWLAAYNAVLDRPVNERLALLKAHFGAVGNDCVIRPPFFCDYGSNIVLGTKVFFNFNCVVLDVMPVIIGDNVLFGPAVHIYTATHPISAAERRKWLESARPITIGSDVWVGGGAVICPGVTIGDRSVIGAGSVVTRDIPADVFAAGNPARVVRRLDEEASAPSGA